MSMKDTYLDRNFMRMSTLATGWVILGAGIYMLLGGLGFVEIFITALGSAMIIIALDGRLFKGGHYSKSRVALILVMGALLLPLTLFFYEFTLLSKLGWWIYFAGAVALYALSIAMLIRSSQRSRNQP
jgi:hypothetical protein